MSVPKGICVLVECVPTRRGPTPVPGVRLATERLKTGRGVKMLTSATPCLPVPMGYV